MRKASNDNTRRLYNRNQVAFVCYEGKFFGKPISSTELALDQAVTLRKLPSDGGRARIAVIQRSNDGTVTVENWRTVSV